MSSEEIEAVTGGVSIVSDPIYKLNSKEVKGLEAADFILKKTNSGNYRITYKDGKMANPSEIQVLCKVINNSARKDKSIWHYIFGID